MKQILNGSKLLLRELNNISLQNRKSVEDSNAKSKEAVAKFVLSQDKFSREELVDYLTSESEATGDMDFITAAENIKEYS